MNCIICNKEIEKSKYTNTTLCSSQCFITDFWNYYVTQKDNPKCIRIDHTHYYIGSESKDIRDMGFRGFGGRRFTIKHNDGRLIITTNLWHQGDIPKEFWDRLPDNAVWAKTEPEIAAEKLFDNLFNSNNVI